MIDMSQTSKAIAKLMDEFNVPPLPPIFWIGLNKILAENQPVAHDQIDKDRLRTFPEYDPK